MTLTDAIDKLRYERLISFAVRGSAVRPSEARAIAIQRLDQLTGHTKLLEACKAVILRTGRPEIHVLVRLCEEAVADAEKE